LHERLTGRFVDRRTSVLMRRLKENAMLEAEITDAGDVLVEGQHVGMLSGFRFAPDPNADGPDGKALRAAAQKALAGEIARRAEKASAAPNPDFVLAADGSLRWQGAAVAKLAEGDDVLRPRLILLADEMLSGPDRDKVQARLDLWFSAHTAALLKSLFDLRGAENLAAPARGIAFRLVENLGIVERADIADDVRLLDQDARAGMRALGVRFGAYHIYVPQLLKPAPAGLLALLWAVKHGGFDKPGLSELTHLASSGRTSVPVDQSFPRPLYRIVGYRISGNRAVRVDILERLADLIRPLLSWRPTPEALAAPVGAVPGGFTVTVGMTSLLGCAGEDFASVLRSLGYRLDRRPKPPESVVPAPAAAEAADPGPIAPEASASATADGSAGGDASEAPGDTVAAADDEAPALQAEIPDAPADTPVAAAEAPAIVLAAAEGQPAGEIAAEPAEPAFIEVWRPGRTDRGRPPRRDKRPQQHRHAPRPDGAAEASAAPTADAAPAPQGGDGAAAPAPQAPRQRPPQRHDRHRDRDRTKKPADTAPRRPPERREKPVDPDSPFAALAALKARLEAKDGA
jgi:ATP-dependent RNA helicase SUPV3L1/SUV3